jgi:hypothetical protein
VSATFGTTASDCDGLDPATRSNAIQTFESSYSQWFVAVSDSEYVPENEGRPAVPENEEP